jgi:hypothetical protein
MNICSLNYIAYTDTLNKKLISHTYTRDRYKRRKRQKRNLINIIELYDDGKRWNKEIKKNEKIFT